MRAYFETSEASNAVLRISSYIHTTTGRPPADATCQNSSPERVAANDEDDVRRHVADALGRPP
ncbi:hypothetical protein FV141_09870 [Dermacoccus abyssi]|uniref:Uncharacterized protein n=1 Tax=Dermacoccus abyssi TaxID=322596 RepID=A0ABX5ZAR9_9MICO|nr:hypothetical protein FV141_09870 [Dermacoccus abyssi]